MAKLRLVAALVVLAAVAGLASAVRPLPNPMEEPGACASTQATWLCDPDSLLSMEGRVDVERALVAVRDVQAVCGKGYQVSGGELNALAALGTGRAHCGCCARYRGSSGWQWWHPSSRMERRLPKAASNALPRRRTTRGVSVTWAVKVAWSWSWQ